MQFPKTNNLLPNQLTQDTLNRFTELELRRLHYILTRTTQNPNPIFISMICPYLTDYHEPLTIMLNDFRFQNPSEAELVHYFRYKNIAMQKIRKYTNVQLNHLVRGGKYDEVPNLKPVFPCWQELTSSLQTWESIKHFFNLFNDELIHTLVPEEKDISKQPKRQQPKQKEEEHIPTLEELLEEDKDNPFVQANAFLNNWGN